MKRTAYILALLLAAAFNTACAGLSVNFDAAITYRSDVPAGERGK